MEKPRGFDEYFKEFKRKGEDVDVLIKDIRDEIFDAKAGSDFGHEDPEFPCGGGNEPTSEFEDYMDSLYEQLRFLEYIKYLNIKARADWHIDKSNIVFLTLMELDYFYSIEKISTWERNFYISICQSVANNKYFKLSPRQLNMLAIIHNNISVN
jgi:hypothetical protein